VVVGWADTPQFNTNTFEYYHHAFIYSNGVMQDIHGLAVESIARDINDWGEAVGIYSIPDDNPPGGSPGLPPLARERGRFSTATAK